MKFPSFGNIFSGTKETIERFPLTLLCVYVATSILIWSVDRSMFSENILQLIYATIIGGLYFLSAKIICESYTLSTLHKVIIYSGAALITIGYYILFPTNLRESSMCFIWISLGLIIIGHLLVSVVPFAFSGRSTLSFRSYNYQLLLRFGQAVFYSLILFATLSIALSSLDFLFDIDIKGSTYSRLFIFLAGIFNTTYFLSQFPKNFEEETYGRPKGLKVLAEYIMIPVMIIYTLILYAYIIKVIASLTGPVTEVRYMIIAFLVIGVFTYLINFFDDSEDRSTLSKYYVILFFPVASPVAILLLLAAYNESINVGITDEIYLHSIIAIWSIGMAIYIIISKRDNIKIIPISLIIISIISFFTPIIGVCDMTVSSQFDQVKNKIKEHKIYIDNKLVRSEKTIRDSDFSNSLRYLDRYNRLDLVKALDSDNIITDTVYNYSNISRALNIGYSNSRSKRDEKNHLKINNSSSLPIDVSEYEELIFVTNSDKNGIKTAQFVHNKNKIEIKDGMGRVIHTYDLTNQIDSITYDTKYLLLKDESSEAKLIIHNSNIDLDKKKFGYTRGVLLFRNK